MTDVHELLQRKENDIIRVRKEIQALRFVAQLLSEPGDAQGLQSEQDYARSLALGNNTALENSLEDAPLSPGAEASLESIPAKQNRLRNWFSLAAGE